MTPAAPARVTMSRAASANGGGARGCACLTKRSARMRAELPIRRRKSATRAASPEIRPWSVTEVPVSYRKRVGVSKITGTVKGTVLAGYKILFTVLRYSFGPMEPDR